MVWMGGACNHIKASFGVSLFPHQREFCTEGLLGWHTFRTHVHVCWENIDNMTSAACIYIYVAVGGVSLPPNKKWHLFVSHSTSSQDWTRDTIVARLTGSTHLMRVAACYQSMPDQSRYDDKEIQSRMRDSCAVLIALSPQYLRSERLIFIVIHMDLKYFYEWYLYI